jgi:NADPH:quinone reductase-like Zn-dependent oxidoreductase
VPARAHLGGDLVPVALGHEPAGEVVEVGAEVDGLKVGDRVVVNPQDAPTGIIGCGGRYGGMSEYLLIQNAEAGRSVAVFPDPPESPSSSTPWCSRRSGARSWS